MYETRTHGGVRGSPRQLITGGAVYTISGSALIAKYMEFRIPQQTHNLNWIFYNGVFQAMKFDSDWNWLMLVVEKIEK